MKINSLKLYFDTSNSEKIIVGLDEKRFETDARQEKSQKLLPFVSNLLKEHGKSLKDITEVKVNTGPGSFTGLRIGVAVANALGWSLGILVNGKNLRKGEVVDIKYE